MRLGPQAEDTSLPSCCQAGFQALALPRALSAQLCPLSPSTGHEAHMIHQLPRTLGGPTLCSSWVPSSALPKREGTMSRLLGALASQRVQRADNEWMRALQKHSHTTIGDKVGAQDACLPGERPMAERTPKPPSMEHNQGRKLWPRPHGSYNLGVEITEPDFALTRIHVSKVSSCGQREAFQQTTFCVLHSHQPTVANPSQLPGKKPHNPQL